MQIKTYVALAGIALITAIAEACGAAVYTLRPLDEITNLGRINNAGQIVSTQIVGGNYHATVWTPDGAGGYTARDLSPVLGANNYGKQINASGQVAGYAGSRAFMWKDTGGLGTAVDLGDPNPLGSEELYSQGINDGGTVAAMGWDFYGGGGFRAFVWRPTTPNGVTGTVIPIGGGGGVDVEPNGINNVGDVVGSGTNGAFLWKGSTGTSYPLGGLTGPGGHAGALDINDAGQIVGSSSAPGGAAHAFVWTPTTPNGTAGSMTDLGILPGGANESQANEINASGVVVGQSGNFVFNVSTPLAFVWSSTDGLRDLNTLVDGTAAGWTLEEAVHINDTGLITGYGLYDPDGPGGVGATTRGFLLTPVPEPQVLGLLAAILTALAGRRRKCRNVSPRRHAALSIRPMPS
jgi:probable HAF family extracellular repeat protein